MSQQFQGPQRERMGQRRAGLPTADEPLTAGLDHLPPAVRR
jgi:hypothetical protein